MLNGKIAVENDLMDKGTFKLSLRDIIVIISFVVALSGQWYASKSTMEALVVGQNGKMELIRAGQEVIKADIAAIKTQNGILCLQTQKIEVDIAVMKLQIRGLEKDNP